MLNHTATTVPRIMAGSWRVDPTAGHVDFRVRSMWGLTDVKGSFSAYQGSLTGATGEFVVDTASVDTGKSRRDTHLRSADFFDSDVHPQARFAVTDVRPGPGGQIVVSGELAVGPSHTSLDVPVVVEPAGDRAVNVRVRTSIPRAALGLDWNWMGAIKGDARLDIELRLTGSGG